MRHRSRWQLALLAGLTVPVGLLTRATLPIPALIATYGGDTLYATLVFFLVALIWPDWSSWRIALVALGSCFVIEFSQLVSLAWLDAIRQTWFGRLVLGTGFLWSDLVCYSLGILLGILLDRLIRLRQ